MTTAAAQPTPARVPTPRPKASRTSSLQPQSTAATKLRHNQSLASTEGVTQSQQPGLPRRSTRAASADPLSDKTTAFLIRRILCPQQVDKGKSSPESIEGLLPPLTSRNDVDLQLYALIAIILKEFVQNWYSKITPDETFVAEIVQIIAHITRALEQRLRKVDLESLLFDELPDVLNKHVIAYRVAHEPVIQPPVKTDPREVYHSMCPLPALSPVPRPEDPESVTMQAENEAAYRQLLVHASLAILLPTEDLENDCLTALVGQILSELIIGNGIANRLSQPWLVWELLIIAARAAGGQRAAEERDRLRRLSHGSLSAKKRLHLSVHTTLSTILQWCFLAVSFARTVFTILLASGSMPSRTSHGASAEGATQDRTSHESVDLTRSPDADLLTPRTPVLAFQCWSTVSNLIEVDMRMPWLRGAMSMLQWVAIMGPRRVAAFDGVLDRFLSYSIQRHILSAANLPPLLRAVRGALFPNNMPAGEPTLVPPSSDVELRALRHRCASALWALVPKGVGRLYFGGGLLRAKPVLKTSKDKTEGSADLRTAVLGELDNNGKDLDRDKGSSPSSSSSAETGTREKANPIETAPTQARGQERSRSGSQSRSWRTAPVPRPKTGGQVPATQATAAATVSADPPRPPPPSKTANVCEGARSGMALTENEKFLRQDGNYDAIDVHDDDDDEEILMEIEQSILGVFSDPYCNKHLLYSVLELILVRLLPELTEKGVLELWKERVSL